MIQGLGLLSLFLGSLNFKGSEFEVELKKNFIELTCPSHRYDIEIKEDVIEEIARIIGYDNLPSKRLKFISSSVDTSIKKELLSKDIFVNAGFNEVINTLLLIHLLLKY